MAGCDTIDWARIMDPEGFSPEETEHIRTCPECRQELEEIQTLHKVFGDYFEIAENARCPCEKDVPELVWPNGKTVDAALESHMKACPVCTRAFLEMKAFDQSFEAPPAKEPPLPRALGDAVRAYRRQQAATRTRQVLEQFAARAKNGGKWVEKSLQNIFGDRAGQPAPAARDDLTRSRKEQADENAGKEDREPGKQDE